jgi:hypothetical protein
MKTFLIEDYSFAAGVNDTDVAPGALRILKN